MSEIKKSIPITINIVRGSNYIIKKIRGKLQNGVVVYSGMDKENPIVWLGHPEYAVYNQQAKQYELFYNEIRATLIKVDIGQTISSNSIVDLTRNFTLAVQNTDRNMNANKTNNDALKWAIGGAILIILFAMIFAFLISSHNGTSTAATHSVASVVNGTGAIFHIPK